VLGLGGVASGQGCVLGLGGGVANGQGCVLGLGGLASGQGWPGVCAGSRWGQITPETEGSATTPPPEGGERHLQFSFAASRSVSGFQPPHPPPPHTPPPQTPTLPPSPHPCPANVMILAEMWIV
jgi:hypothetical protein